MLELDIGHASMKDARSPSCATRPASLCNIFHVQLKKKSYLTEQALARRDHVVRKIRHTKNVLVTALQVLVFSRCSS